MINGKSYKTTVTCVSISGVVYCIEANQFENVLKQDEVTWKMI